MGVVYISRQELGAAAECSFGVCLARMTLAAVNDVDLGLMIIGNFQSHDGKLEMLLMCISKRSTNLHTPWDSERRWGCLESSAFLCVYVQTRK